MEREEFASCIPELEAVALERTCQECCSARTDSILLHGFRAQYCEGVTSSL